jgi:hypothetical protein
MGAEVSPTLIYLHSGMRLIPDDSPNTRSLRAAREIMTSAWPLPSYARRGTACAGLLIGQLSDGLDVRQQPLPTSGRNSLEFGDLLTMRRSVATCAQRCHSR